MRKVKKRNEASKGVLSDSGPVDTQGSLKLAVEKQFREMRQFKYSFKCR
jgi:hypothetical protein